jgi:type IV fimbrial biogenesis protein FimT
MANQSNFATAKAYKARRAPGFTLIEMMVVVALLAIIVSIAVPSFRHFLNGQRVRGMAYDLTTDLLLARSEALKRNMSVAITRSGGEWTAGWAATAGGARISERGPLSGEVTVSGAPAAITFDANGRVSAPADEVRITISTGSTSRCVELSPSGRARSLVGACA